MPFGSMIGIPHQNIGGKSKHGGGKWSYMMEENGAQPWLMVEESQFFPSMVEKFFLIEGGLYSVTALLETWARRRCILNTRTYHKQASTTSKAHFTRRSSSSSGSHSASSASVASSLCGVLSFRGFVLVRRECVRVGGGPKASLAPGLTRPVCRAPVPVDRGVPRSSEGAGAPKVHVEG